MPFHQVGEQLREAQHINKSLSSLELVMSSLQERSKREGSKEGKDGGHIPYRNSKLTLLLSDALGAKGSCAKTIMIVQASPAASNAAESLRTLRFGERCQSVCLGSVKRGASASSKSSGKAAEAAAAAEERSQKLQSDLIESRRAARCALSSLSLLTESRRSARCALPSLSPLTHLPSDLAL